MEPRMEPVVMARQSNRIAATALPKLLRTPGRHADGNGLYLFVAGSKASWVFRYRDRRTSVQRDMGLGSASLLTLAEARAKALEARRMLASGQDPIDSRHAEREAARASQANTKTFGDCALACIEAKRPEWRSGKHADQWRRTLEADGAVLWAMPVASIELRHVLQALEPIWTSKTETASRLRQRIEAVLDWATVRGFRSGDNPARWRGNLESLLAKPSKAKAKGHHAAVPYVEAPAVLAAVRERTSISARLLELVMLSACRVNEAASARWVEFDLDKALWTIPADRMKSGREHEVPLCPALVRMLADMPRVGEFVFPGMTRGGRQKPVVPDSARALLQREIGRAETVHGFRSSFRDWAAERTSYPREVCEAALAHVVADKTEAAYLRTKLLEKRRLLMCEWADFLAQPEPMTAATVTPIGTARAAR